jgi:hypothetical protein
MECGCLIDRESKEYVYCCERHLVLEACLTFALSTLEEFREHETAREALETIKRRRI